MRKQMFTGALVCCVLALATVPLWAQGGPRQGMCLLATETAQALEPAEARELAYIREQEKLAMDFNAAMQARWGLRVFDNISRSEKRHFAAMKLLLDRHNLPAPVQEMPAGTFSDPGLQTMYGDLMNQGEQSLESALRAAASIEDFTIHNLDKAIAATDKSDLKMIYGNLRNGSTNHIRALVRQLQRTGQSYSPQYVSPAVFSEIMNDALSPRGRGLGAGYGSGRGGGGGRGGAWGNSRFRP